MSSVEKELELLEDELKALAPAAPRLELHERIASELDVTSRKPWPVIIGLAAALLIGLGVVLQQSSSSTTQEQQVAGIDWQPIPAEPEPVKANPSALAEESASASAKASTFVVPPSAVMPIAPR